MDTMILLSDFCDNHGIDYKHARRLARKNKFPGAQKMLGAWAINGNADVPTLPEPNTRGSSRTDGRQRYIVYMTVGEYQTFLVTYGNDGATIVDPREQRRLRKLADADAADADENARNELRAQMDTDADE